jgi:hypothetical protein
VLSVAADAEGLALPLLVTASRTGHAKQSLGAITVAAAALETLEVPPSQRAE